jgi:hypothetical protein
VNQPGDSKRFSAPLRRGFFFGRTAISAVATSMTCTLARCREGRHRDHERADLGLHDSGAPESLSMLQYEYLLLAFFCDFKQADFR